MVAGQRDIDQRDREPAIEFEFETGGSARTAAACGEFDPGRRRCTARGGELDLEYLAPLSLHVTLSPC